MALDPFSPAAITLVSFDIDGTLEVGDPPGLVTAAMVRRARELGYLIGSCSDRPLSHQERIWEGLGIEPEFIVLKHRLGDVRARFRADVYYHIGDTDIDAHFASGAGFRFLRADATTHQSWGPALFSAG
jgi:phosphoglycolate phosphatase-like HAD superfamily hydrolase